MWVRGGMPWTDHPRVEFDQVDRTTDPMDFVPYLDSTRVSDFFQQIKQRSYELLDLTLANTSAMSAAAPATTCW